MEIKSGKTAIYRNALSVPLRLLLKQGYLDPKRHRVFDLGHGLGDDMRALAKRGFRVGGWDPNHDVPGFSCSEWPPVSRPAQPYNFVYCGYVLNVLESVELRRTLVEDVYDFLARDREVCLAARSHKEVARSRKDNWKEHGDGWITTTGTFQHGMTPAEVVDILDKAGFCEMHVISRGPVIVHARK
jgi:DNA phosphorothioation-associated putative methyltransferase